MRAGRATGPRRAVARKVWRRTSTPSSGDCRCRRSTPPSSCKVLEPIWTEKPETASRVRGRIEAVLELGQGARLPRGRESRRCGAVISISLLPSKRKVRRVEHHAALPFRDIGALMAKLRAEATTSARALEFMILTATRVGETLGARWDEIDLEQRMWIDPGQTA